MYRFAVVLFLFFGLTSVASAASLYLDPATVSINRGDAVKVAVRVAPDEATGECINAVDGIITFDASIQPVDISLGSSIFSMWVEPPTIDEEKRTITFAGGIPNGYCGRIEGDPRLSNIIAEIIFRSPGFQIGGGSDIDSATIAISPDSKIYLNDGQGTQAPLRTFNSVITLSKTAGEGIVDPWRQAVLEDTNPPGKFSISLERDDKTFGGRYYIVFNTLDKETGLSHYEIMEEPVSELGSFAWGRADAPWIQERSPYPLKDQSLNSVIRVKAVDKAGNEYVATLLPDETLRSLSTARLVVYGLLAVAVVILLIVVFVVIRLVRRRRVAKLGSAEVTETTL